MKKIFSVLLVAVIVSIAFSSCAGEKTMTVFGNTVKGNKCKG